MQHDRNGDEVKVDDVVLVPFRVTWIGGSKDYCNLNLTTLPLGQGEVFVTISLNSRQVEKAKALPAGTAGEQAAG